MDLEWESIVHSDFPAVRRGYDPAAVEAHLMAIAEAVRDTPAPTSSSDSLAANVSEQVGAIVAAAEATAAQIRAQTAARAEEIEVEVREAVLRSAEASVAQARHDAANVSAASREIITRLDTIGVDFAQMVKELHERANSISGAMAQIEGIVNTKFDIQPMERPGPSWAPTPQTDETIRRLRESSAPAEVAAPEPLAVEPEPEPEPEAVAPEPVVIEPVAAPEPVVFVEPEPEVDPESESAFTLVEEVAPEYDRDAEFDSQTTIEMNAADASLLESAYSHEEAAATPGEVDDDPAVIDDARIVALDMALSGLSREDISSYVSSNFELSNPGALVDEVLASVED